MARSLVQIATSGGWLYALATDGTLWMKEIEFRSSGAVDVKSDGEFHSSAWMHIEGPPEGEPGKKVLSPEEVVERMRKAGVDGGTAIGRGHQLGKGLG